MSNNPPKILYFDHCKEKKDQIKEVNVQMCKIYISIMSLRLFINPS